MAEGGGKPLSSQRGCLSYPIPDPQSGFDQPCQLCSPSTTNKWEEDGKQMGLFYCFATSYLWKCLKMLVSRRVWIQIKFCCSIFIRVSPASPEWELQALWLIDWKKEMYSFPVTSVSASLYLALRGYFTALQPSVNLCWLLAASLQQHSCSEVWGGTMFYPGAGTALCAVSSRNRPSLNSNKSPELKYYPDGGCGLGNKLRSSPWSDSTHWCQRGISGYGKTTFPRQKLYCLWRQSSAREACRSRQLQQLYL